MSALFSFQSLLVVACLIICTCTYIRANMPTLLDKNKKGYVNSAVLGGLTVSTVGFSQPLFEIHNVNNLLNNCQNPFPIVIKLLIIY